MKNFETSDVWEKMHSLDADLEGAFRHSRVRSCAPFEPARDVEVRPVKDHPRKESMNEKTGQARLLHDLASIELQAMELALRTLAEFPDAPPAFRHELAEIARGEAQHLRLCLEGIDSLGHRWGDWPVHVALWHAVSEEDSLLDRILIVHRYLEGSGLDAGDSILRRLGGVESRIVRAVVNVIVNEEIGHVKFGSDWYRRVCALEGIDPEEDFSRRLGGLALRLPRRMERVSRPLRAAAGFTDGEMDYLEDLRLKRIETRV